MEDVENNSSSSQNEIEEKNQTEEKVEDNDEGKEEEVVKPDIVFKRSSVLLARSHDDRDEEGECSYCNGIRIVDDPDTKECGIKESDLKYHKLGFTSTKLTCRDLEWCLNRGFTRCGTYIYQRNSKISCCEVWQYRVDIGEFKISSSQKKVIRRFHNYLNYGDIHGLKKDEVMKLEVNENFESQVKIRNDLKDLIFLRFDKNFLQNLEMQHKLQSQDLEFQLNDIRQKILSHHKVTYNFKQKCLQSNILMVSRNQEIDVAA